MAVEKKRVLLITSELTPYVETSEFAQILNKLAVMSFEAGMEVRVIMPRFGSINERRHRLHEVVRLSGINVIIDKDDFPLIIKVASLPNARLQVYFMDNDDYFKRKKLYHDDQDKFFDDNAERMIFFCRSALETVKKFGWPPHLIHCHGWLSSLIPTYLKTAYKKEPVFSYNKVVTTAQSPQFDDVLGESFLRKALVGDMKEKDLDLYSKGDYAAMTLGAAKSADVVIMGDDNIESALSDEIKPSRYKKIVPYSSDWKEDPRPLFDLYESLTES